MSEGKLTIHESKKELSKKHPYSKKLFSFTKLLSLGNLATLIGIIGGIIVFINFINEQPKLSLTSPKVKVGSIFQKTYYQKSLNKIEDKHAQHTGSDITSLIDNVENIDSNSQTLKKDVDHLLKQLTKSIQDFENYDVVRKDNYNKIINQLDSIKNSLDTPNNLSNVFNDLEQLEENYTDYTDQHINNLKSLVSNFMTKNLDEQNYSQAIISLKKIFDRKIEDFRSQIFSEDDRSKDNNETSRVRKEISKELKTVKSHLEEYTKGNNDQIFLEVVIENKSSLKNLIHSQAMITFYDHTDPYASKNISNSISVPIRITNPELAVVNDRGLINLKFESEPFQGLGKDIRTSIVTSFKNNYRYVVIIEDLHGKLWSVFGRTPTGFNGKSKNIKRFEDESEQLILKKSPKRSLNLFCR